MGEESSQLTTAALSTSFEPEVGRGAIKETLALKPFGYSLTAGHTFPL